MAPKNNNDTKVIIKEIITELLTNEEFLSKILTKVNDKFDALERDIRQKADKISQLEKKIEGMQQNEKRNNICIYNLPEEKNERLYGRLLQLFNEKVGVATRREDIISCYRIGRDPDGNKPRPVVVKFELYQQKHRMLANSVKLKGTKIGFSEDLIKSRLVIYRQAQEKFGRKDVCTRFGSVFVKRGESSHKVSNSEDIDNLST